MVDTEEISKEIFEFIEKQTKKNPHLFFQKFVSPKKFLPRISENSVKIFFFQDEKKFFN
jgi:hypothetical protein